MVSSIVEKTVPEIAKTYRLTQRRDDGTADYVSVNDPEGTEFLSVKSDGSMFRHIVVGFVLTAFSGSLMTCAFAGRSGAECAFGRDSPPRAGLCDSRMSSHGWDFVTSSTCSPCTYT